MNDDAHSRRLACARGTVVSLAVVFDGVAVRRDAHGGREVRQVQHLLPERSGVDWPVREQQVVPGLRHDPGPIRRWPRTMGDLVQHRAIEVVIGHVILSLT
jgi:hypothetical protein